MTEDSEQLTADVIEDDDIVLHILEREEDGLRLLLRKYGGPIKAFLRSKFGAQFDDDDRGDILHQVAFRVWRYIGSFDESKGALVSWLFGITQNQALDVLEKEQLPKGSLEHDPVDSVSGEDEELSPVKRRLLQDLDEIIGGLPKRLQEVAREDLRCGGEADGPALAQKLGTSPNAIRIARSKARKAIRERLEAIGHELGDFA